MLIPTASTQTDSVDVLKLEIELVFMNDRKNICSHDLDHRLLMPKESKIIYNSDLSETAVHSYRTIYELFKEEDTGIEATFGCNLRDLLLWDENRGYVRSLTPLDLLSDYGKVTLTLQAAMWDDKIKIFLTSEEGSDDISPSQCKGEVLGFFMNKFYSSYGSGGAAMPLCGGVRFGQAHYPTSDTVGASQIIETAFLRCILDVDDASTQIPVSCVKEKAYHGLLHIDNAKEKFVVFKILDEQLHDFKIKDDVCERYEIKDLGLINCFNNSGIRAPMRAGFGALGGLGAFPMFDQQLEGAGAAEQIFPGAGARANNLVSGLRNCRVIAMPLDNFNRLINEQSFSLPSDYALENNYDDDDQAPVYRC